MPTPDQGSSPYRVQSVFDAFGLLEMLVAAKQPMTASQIAAMTHDSRNRSFRLLKTLEECGYVTHSVTDRTYLPTLKLFTLGQSISRNQSIEAIAQAVMKTLADETGETVYLTIREGFESVCLLTIESTHAVRITAQPGSRWSLGVGATGAALLLAAPEPVRERFFIDHPDAEAAFDCTRKKFKEEGVVVVDGREGTILDEGILAVGAPIRDSQGNADYALAIAWPYTRSSTDYNTLRVALLNAIERIERKLGVSHDRLPAGA